MKLYSFKKFNKKEVTLKERKNLKDMELGLDLTKDKSDKYIMKKTIEYLKENYEF